MNIDHKIPSDEKEFFYTGYNERLYQDIWNKVMYSDNIFSRLDGRNEEHFHKLMIESPAWVVFSFGYVRMHPLEAGHYAQLHGYFWDRRVMRNLSILREALEGAFRIFLLKRVECIVPEYMRGLNKFMKKMGFKKEGTLELYYKLRGGELINGNMYAIVKKEEQDG